MPEPTILVHDASCRAIYAVPMSHVRQVTISDFHTPAEEAEVTVYVELRVTNERSDFIESDKHFAILTYRGLSNRNLAPDLSGQLSAGLGIFNNFTGSKVTIDQYMMPKSPEPGFINGEIPDKQFSAGEIIRPNAQASQAAEDLGVFIPRNTVD